MNLWQLLLVVIGLICGCESARILAIIPMPFYSHHIIFQPIWKELSGKHEIVVVTMKPINDPNLTNLTEIDISHVKCYNVLIAEFLSGKQKLYNSIDLFIDYYMKITDGLMDMNFFKSLINGNEGKFDAVMYEWIFPIFGALCLQMDVPCISLSALELDESLLRNMVLPPHSAVYLNFLFPVYKDLTFIERCYSEAFQLFVVPYGMGLFACAFDNKIRKYFGSNYSTYAIEKNVDMVFVNTDPVFTIKRPKLPHVIEFNGVQMKEKKVLPKDLKEFVELNSNGTIFMSLGSSINDNHLDDTFLRIIRETFAELPYNVLWKRDNKFESTSVNVKIIEWGPQPDILRHENVKLFISHGGLHSVSEAFHSDTPQIVLPFCADAARWARMVEQLDMGIRMEPLNLDKQKFKSAIMEVITNKKYKTETARLARLSEDQQMSDLQNIIWWTEYVIRNKGAKHLRSPILDLPWYKYYYVDVYGLFVLIIVIACYTIYFIVQFLKSLTGMWFVKIKIS